MPRESAAKRFFGRAGILRKKRKDKAPLERKDREIVALARLVLVLCSSLTNVLIAIDEIRKIFPRLQLKIVDDDLLPDKEALAYPGRWIIKIRRVIYEELLRGGNRGRWTLIHELGHVLLRHPGTPARHRTRKQSLKLASDKLEREANKFARAVLIPFDLCSELSLEQIKKRCGVSTPTAERRLIEFADAKAIRDASIRRRLDLRLHTSEFAHAAHLEKQVAGVAHALADASKNPDPASSSLLNPLNQNSFSTAAMVGAASGLLQDAYWSVKRQFSFYRHIPAAALVIAIANLRPLRGSEPARDEHCLLSNLKVAFSALRYTYAFSVASDNHPILSELATELSSNECYFLRDVAKLGENSITQNSLLTLESFPRYEDYNADHDVIWDNIHQVEMVARRLAEISSID